MLINSFTELKAGIDNQYFKKKFSTDECETILDSISTIVFPEGEYGKPWVKHEIFKDSDLSGVNWEEITRFKGKDCLAGFNLAYANLQFSNLADLNLVNTPLPEPIFLRGVKLRDAAITFQQMARFYKAGVRDFSRISLSGEIDNRETLFDILISDSTFNYLQAQGYMDLDRVHVTNPSSVTRAFINDPRKHTLKAGSTVGILKRRQARLRDLRSLFPRLAISTFPYTPSLKPYLMETAIAEIPMAGAGFSSELRRKNFKAFTENLVTLESVLQEMITDNITINESQPLENFTRDLQANTCKTEAISHYVGTSREEFIESINKLTTGQGLKLTQLNDASHTFKRVIHLYKGGEYYDYFDENYWISGLAASFIYPLVESIYPDLLDPVTQFYVERYRGSNTITPSLINLRAPYTDYSKASNIHELTKASQYLSLLKQQKAKLKLTQLTLLENAESSLRGTPAELQRVKEVNDLLRECQRQGRTELLCFFLLEKILSEPNEDLHKRLVNLPSDSDSTLSVQQKEALNTLETQTDTNLKRIFETSFADRALTRFESLSEEAKANAKAVLSSAGLATAFNDKILKSGGTAAVADVEGRSMRVGAVQRGRMLGDIKEDISTTPGIRVLNKVLTTDRTRKRQDCRSQVKEGSLALFQGGKTLKVSKGTGALGMLLLAAYASYEGGKSVSAYTDILLGSLEKIGIFSRGVINVLFKPVNPHPSSVEQFLNERKIIEKLTEAATNLLKGSPKLLTYSGCLGRVSTDTNNRLKVEPDFCSVNLERKRQRQGSPKGERYFNIFVGTRLKSRKTPVMTDANLKIICAPKFREDKEPVGSGSLDSAAYECDQGFSILNETRSGAAGDKNCWNYFDAGYADSGNLMAPAKANNFLDASENPATLIHYEKNQLILKEPSKEPKFIQTKNMNYYRGRKNLQDIVDCSQMSSLRYVETQGNDTRNPLRKDELHNCRYATLSPDTLVVNTEAGIHRYRINLGKGNIFIHTLNNEVTLDLHFQLPLTELLRRITLSSKKIRGARELLFVIDKMSISINAHEDTVIRVFDNQLSQLTVKEKDNVPVFHITENMDKCSDEEKLKKCHAYQRFQTVEKPLTCSITTTTETGSGWSATSLFVDEQGQGWNFITASESTNLDEMVPFLGEGVHTFSAASMVDITSMAIPVDVKHILYFRDGDDFIVKANREMTTVNFIGNFKNYYKDPARWKALQLIYLEGGAFNCNTRKNCIPGEDFESYSRLAIPQTQEIEAISELFQHYSFRFPHGSQEKTLFHNQQLDASGNLRTLDKKDRRPGYIKLENCNPSRIIFETAENTVGGALQSTSDAVFTIIDVDDNKLRIYMENWVSTSVHQTEGFVFDTLTIAGLSGFSGKSPEALQAHLNRGLLEAKINEEIKKLEKSPLDSTDLKSTIADQLLTKEIFLYDNFVPKKEIIYKGLGFQSEKELDFFLLLHSLDQPEKSHPKLFQSHEDVWQRLSWWLAAKACLVLDRPKTRILFSMLEPRVARTWEQPSLAGDFVNSFSPVAGLWDLMSRRVMDRNVDFTVLKPYIEAMIEYNKPLLNKEKKAEKPKTLYYRLAAFDFNSYAAPHTLYHNQIRSASETGVLAEEDRKKAVIDLGDSTVENIRLKPIMNDLVFTFHIKDSDDISLKFKNGMNRAFRPEKIMSDGRELFDLTTLNVTSDFYGVEKNINKVLKVNWLEATQREFIAPQNLRTLKAFLYAEALLKGSPLAQCFGFNSEALLNEFIQSYGKDFPDETERQSKYQFLFKGENPRNLKALYLHLAQAAQTELTEDEIVRCYPFLPATFVRGFTSKFKLFEKFFMLEGLVDNAILGEPIAKLEIQWAAEGINFQLLNSTELYLSDYAYQVNAQPIAYKLTEVIPRGSHTIYHNQIQDLSGKWVTKQKETELESAYIELGDAEIERIAITREANDVRFCFTNANDNTISQSLVFKNWDAAIHRPEKISSKDGFEFNLKSESNIERLQKAINSRFIEAWAKKNQARLIISSALQGDLISFLSANTEETTLLSRCLGLSVTELEHFRAAYNLKYPTEEQRQANYQALFTRKNLRKLNIRILLWELVQTAQRDLTMNEIQSCFSFIPKHFLNSFVSYFRTHSGFKNFEEKLNDFAEDTALAWEIQKAAQVLKVYDLSPPFSYLGFETRSYLNLETVAYDSIGISSNEDESVTFLLRDSKNKSQEKLHLKWDEPTHRLYGLMDKKKGWEIPDLYQYSPNELRTLWPELFKKALSAARKKTKARQSIPVDSVTEALPIVKNRVSITGEAGELDDLPKAGLSHYQIHGQDGQEKNATVHVIEEDARPSWTDVFRSWGAWSAGLLSTGGLMAAGYVTWRLRRQWAHQRNRLPTVTESAALISSNLPAANAASIGNDHFNSPKESLNSLRGPSVNSVNTGENNFLSCVSAHWDGQGTLSLLNVGARLLTDKKNCTHIGNYSHDSSFQAQLDAVAFSVEEAFQGAIRKGWCAEESLEKVFWGDLSEQAAILSKKRVSQQKKQTKKTTQNIAV